MSEEFNKKIAADFGLVNMDSREQTLMIEKIGNLLFESVIERAVDKMDGPAMNDFEDILADANNDYRRVISFLKERAPDFDTIVSEEMNRLKRATSGIFA